MKKILILFVGLFLVMTACDEETFFETTSSGKEALSEFSITGPVSNEAITLNAGTPNEVVTFTWDAPTSGLGSAVTYSLLFDLKDGDFSNPVTLTSDNEGASTTLSATHQQLNDALATFSPANGASVELLWRVQADNGTNTQLSAEAFNLTMTAFDNGISAFSLLSPASNSRVVVSATTINISWDASTSVSGGDATYTWSAINKGGDFSDPLLTLPSDNDGAATTLTVSANDLGDLLEAQAIPTDEVANLRWRVTAHLDDITVNSTEVFLLNVQFAYNTIGIIGSATPGGWDEDTDMSLVSDDNEHIWQAVIALTEGELKFRADDDWAVNWGAADYPSGVAVQDGPNVPIAEAGNYLIVFNDLTGEYTISNNYSTIGIIGSATPGGWDSDTDMTVDNDNPHLWTIITNLTEGEMKFRAEDAWTVNWGAADFPSGVAVQDGPNIPISTAGPYQITFNDETGEYSVDEAPTYATVGVIGSATPGGWDSDTDMYSADGHSWTIVVKLSAGEVKFRADDAWSVNWGAADFPSGTGVQDGPNIPIATAGHYRIDFNDITKIYTITEVVNPTVYTTVGIIGSATPGGWDSDTDMTQDSNDPHIWTITDVVLVDGEAKFRADDAWTVNWGSNTFTSGEAVQDGPNVPVPAGTYDIVFNDISGIYTFTAK